MSARHAIEQELVALTRFVLDRPRPTPLVGDEHDRAVANEAYELQHVSRQRNVARLRELRAALARMDAGTYGKCDLCGDAIGDARLKALPAVEFCIGCQTSIERDATLGGRGRREDETDDD